MSRRKARRVLLEALEPRQLLTVSAQISVLHLSNYSGSSSAADIASGIGTVYVEQGTTLHVSAVSVGAVGSEAQYNSFADPGDPTNSATAVANDEAIRSNISWNFGETGNSHNVVPGFAVGHVYDTASPMVSGSYVPYQLTLTIQPPGGGSLQTTSLNVIVTPYTASHNIYVSSSGSSSVSGSTSGAPTTWAHMVTLLGSSSYGDNTNVYLRDGDTIWTTSDGTSTGTYTPVPFKNSSTQVQLKDVRFDDYAGGSGKPILKIPAIGHTSNLFSMGSSNRNISIRDLEILGSDGTGGTTLNNDGVGIQPDGSNILVANVSFIHVFDAMNVSSSALGGLLIQDCDTGTTVDSASRSVPDGIGEYFLYVSTGSTDVTLLNNWIGPSTITNHNTRTYSARTLAYQNTLRQYNTDSLRANNGDYIYWANNTVLEGQVYVGSFNDQTGYVPINDVVIENNQCLYEATPSGVSPLDQQRVVTPHYEGAVNNVMIRNNYIEGVASHPALEVKASPTYIYNNTFNLASGDGDALDIYVSANHSRVQNNLMVAPSGAVAVNLPDTTSVSFLDNVSRNVWSPSSVFKIQGGSTISLATWNGATGTPDDTQVAVNLDSTQHRPNDSTFPAAVAAPIDGVYTDGYGDSRPATTWTAGAYEAVPPVAASLVAALTGTSTIQLTWNDNSLSETGYIVERQDGSGSFSAISGTLAANTTSYVDSDPTLQAGHTYTYRVRVQPAPGTTAGYSANSNSVQLAPAAPSATAASVTSISPSVSISISWTDNSSNEDGFRVERKTGTGGTYASIGTTAANVTSLTDSTAVVGTEYYYRVFATSTTLGDSLPSPELYVPLPTSGHALTVNGTSSADSIGGNIVSSAFVLTYNSGVVTYSSGVVTSLIVNGNDGNDNVTLQSAVTFATTLNGGNGNDTLLGGAGADYLNGQAGNDSMSGQDGNDTLYAGTAADGSDTLIGGNGTNTADYSQRTNALTITLDATATDGESGENDLVDTTIQIVIGGGGNDSISAGSVTNAVSLYGAGGADNLVGSSGNDYLEGGAGNDSLTGNDGNDTLNGLAGNDNMAGGNGDDLFSCGSAADGADTLSGGAGTANEADYSGRSNALSITMDTLASDGESGENDKVGVDIDIIIGGGGNDSINASGTGVTHSVSLFGAGGADTLSSGASNDSLEGGSGNDSLSAGSGDDSLTGLAGNDTMNGGDGNDYMLGGDGADNITGGLGNDSMFGENGDDTIFAKDGASDQISGGPNDTTLPGDSAQRDTTELSVTGIETTLP